MEHRNIVKLLNYKWLISSFVSIFGLLLGVFIFDQYAVVSGIMICGSILILYYSLICWPLEISGFFTFIKEMNKREIAWSVFIFISVTAFVFAEISRDRFIYFWDFGGYWGVTIEHSRNFFINPIQMLHNLYNSINTSEYNNIIPTLLALPMKIMGESFISYVILILVLFLFPMSLVLSYCFYSLTKLIEWNGLPFPVLLLIILSFPMLYLPLFFGYLDGACLLTVAILWLITVKINWYKYEYKKYLAIAIMLLLLILQRRYFAFFAAGYVFSLLIFVIVKIIQEKTQRLQILKCFILNISLCGLFCLGFLLTFFREFLKQSIFNDFSIAYSAYSTGDYFDNFLNIGKSLGIFICLLIAVGFIVGITKKQSRSFTIMLVSSLFVTQLLFFRIQSMGMHHRYLLYSQIVILILICISWLYNSLLLKKQWVILLFVSLLLISNFAYFYRLIPTSKLGTMLYSKESYQPKVRDDIAQLQLLANDLKSMTTVDDERIYVLASSTVLNDDILRKLYLPDTLNYILNLDASSNVDLRDGFPTAFLTADFIVVADPIQYHLRPEDQQVVGILAQELLQNGIIGDNFVFLKEYTIQQNIKVKIFKKETNFSKQEIDYLSERFNAVYPQFPNLFKDRIEAFSLY